MVKHLITSLLLAVGVGLLAGCASRVQTLEAKPKQFSAQAVATLATNACEQATAPSYTRAIVAVRKATRRYETGTLDRAALSRTVELGHKAQQLLRDACRDPNKPERAHLDAAGAVVLELVAIAERK